jgi:hypothetical protein
VKRLTLAICLLALPVCLHAQPAGAQSFERRLKPSVMFDTLYGRGSVFPQATTTGPVRTESGQLNLDGSYTDLARIGRVQFGLDANLSELISARLSASLFSSELSDQPLTPAQFDDYASFLRQRWSKQASYWSRPFLLEDVHFVMGDPTVFGTMTLGQQWLPFGYTDHQTIAPPIAIAPQQTPLSEYVNALRQASSMAPWQIGAASRQRQIGSTVNWKTNGFGITTGLYTGAGPNQADNNGALDLLVRADYINEKAEAGLSFWRGLQPGFRQAGTPVPYERMVLGAHARLPYEAWDLTAEYLLGFSDWQDGTRSPYRGGYLTLSVPADVYAKLYVQGAYVQHDNPFDGVLTGYTGLINRQLTLGYKRKVSDFAEVQNDLSYTWEDLSGDSPVGVGYWQYVARVRIAY